MEIVRQLEVDVELLAALERRVDRLHHLPVLLARDLPGRAALGDRLTGARPRNRVGSLERLLFLLDRVFTVDG
jgi:hypothetical protein